ncbi:hypothetical protein Peur_028530 [Populus x canadensis]
MHLPSYYLYADCLPAVLLSQVSTQKNYGKPKIYQDKNSMVYFCFLIDQTRKVRRSKPAAGTCSRCGGGASVADMKTCTRFCYVPFYSRSWRAIMCTFCGAILKSYH